MVNLLKIFDLICKFLKLQIETCCVFGLFFIRKDCFTLNNCNCESSPSNNSATGVMFVSTELLTSSHVRHGGKIQHSFLQWLSVNRPRSWLDYNYIGFHLFMTIERVKDVKYHDENSLSLHQSLCVNRPYLQSVLTITNSAFTFAMAQCEWAKILVGLQLCLPSFVYDY